MIIKAVNDKRTLKFIQTFQLVALTWNQKSAKIIVASREGIVNPSTADEKSSLVVVIDIRQRPKAVNPQAESIKLSSSDSVVAD